MHPRSRRRLIMPPSECRWIAVLVCKMDIDAVTLTFDLLSPKAYHFEYIPRIFPAPSLSTLGSFVFELCWLTENFILVKTVQKLLEIGSDCCKNVVVNVRAVQKIILVFSPNNRPNSVFIIRPNSILKITPNCLISGQTMYKLLNFRC